MLDASKMVSNENPRGLTIEANEVRTTSLILGRHTRKGEINGKTLVRASSNLDRIRTSRCLGLLELDAGRTLVNHRVLGLISKLGNTVDSLVGMIQIFLTGMS